MAVGAPIDPDIAIEDLVRQRPEASAILRRFGIVCIQCGEPVWGTLRQAAAEKGIHDLSEILTALQGAR
jgi:iron-sulfur cluster repair protein YtfE (RIC family)